MNDCFLSWIGACENGKCANCKKYLSVNDEENHKLLEEYQKDIDEAVKPVQEKWANKYSL